MRKTLEFRRFDPLSTGKVMGVLYFVIGALLGLVLGVVALVSSKPGTGLLAIGAPFLYGGLGFVGGLIGAAFYNLVAGWIGGIRVEVGEALD